MRTLPDEEVDRPVRVGGNDTDRGFEDIEAMARSIEMKARSLVQNRRVLTVGAIVAIAAVGIGVIAYRRRRRASLGRRLQGAWPGSFGELPSQAQRVLSHAQRELDDIAAQLKRPLERVAKAL